MFAAAVLLSHLFMTLLLLSQNQQHRNTRAHLTHTEFILARNLIQCYNIQVGKAAPHCTPCMHQIIMANEWHFVSRKSPPKQGPK